MRETVRQAARATVQLAAAVGMACFGYFFITVLLITTVATVAVVGAALRRRVAALDGTFTVTSPPGGPTVIETELPCVW